ncbi:MAG: DUF6901 family protein [Bacteroidota bacterium]
MTAANPHPDVYFRYTFLLENGKEKKFSIVLDPDTLALKAERSEPPPEWTEIGFFPCDDCPLIGSVTHCPVAVNLASIVSEFRDTVSHAPAMVTVETADRTYSNSTTVQKGLSSIIGICMVTSNCPIMDELRPLTRFHLPFATTQETLVRSVSSYLLRQYFVQKEGGTPDWSLDGLIEIYSKISAVNRGISRRISNASKKDANINAIIILHSYGESVPFFIENNLSEIRYLYKDQL